MRGVFWGGFVRDIVFGRMGAKHRIQVDFLEIYRVMPGFTGSRVPGSTCTAAALRCNELHLLLME